MSPHILYGELWKLSVLKHLTTLNRFMSIYVNLRRIYVEFTSIYIDLRQIYVDIRRFTSDVRQIYVI